MTKERTEAEILETTLADYAVRGLVAITALREHDPVSFVRLGVYLRTLPEEDLDKLATEIETKLQTPH